SDGPLYDFHFDKTPFWVAIDHVRDRSKLSLQYQNHFGAFALIPRGLDHVRRPSSQVYYDGVFRLEAYYLHRISSNGGLELSLTMHVEPKLTLLHHRAMKITEASDDQKRSLVAVLDPNRYGGRTVHRGRLASYQGTTEH